MKNKVKKIGIIVVLIIIAYIICSLSYINPMSKRSSVGTDSGVFFYISDRMNYGETPYKDWFDHKGPLLYIIDWIGLNISFWNINGVWLLEILAIFVTLLFTNKILKEKFKLNNIESLILNFLININIVFFFEEGNLVELYALPIITIILYLILKMSKENIKKSNFLIGALLASILCLRINMVAIGVVYYILVFIQCIKEKKVKSLISIILYSFLGAVTVLGIMLIYLLINRNLVECINDYIIFNLKYATLSKAPISDIINSFVKRTNWLLYIAIIISFIIFMRKNKLKIFSILFFIITWIIIIQPRNTYLHYGEILVPTFIVPIAMMYTYLKGKNKNILTGLVIISLLIIPIRTYINIYRNININMSDKEIKQTMIDYIKEKTTEEDTIYVVGNECGIYLSSERKAASKYMYIEPIINCAPEIFDKVIEDLKRNSPKIIVIKGDIVYESIGNIIEENYQLSKEFSYYKIYEIKEQ